MSNKKENLIKIKDNLFILQINSKKGQSFGELSFFTELPRESSAKSNLVSHIAYLTKSDFLNVCKQFPADSVTFFILKNEKMFCRLKNNKE